MSEEKEKSDLIASNIFIEPALDIYDNIVLVPEKLAKANEMASTIGPPNT